MRLIGYLWACVPFAGSRPSWLWEGATVASAAVTPVLAGVRLDTVADWQSWGLWFLCAFILFRIVLVAPYLAWTKLADENDAMRVQLGVSDAREELLDCVGKMVTFDLSDGEFSPLCARLYQLSPRFINADLQLKIDEYCQAFSDGDAFPVKMEKAREFSQWIRSNAH